MANEFTKQRWHVTGLVKNPEDHPYSGDNAEEKFVEADTLDGALDKLAAESDHFEEPRELLRESEIERKYDPEFDEWSTEEIDRKTLIVRSEVVWDGEVDAVGHEEADVANDSHNELGIIDLEEADGEWSMAAYKEDRQGECIEETYVREERFDSMLESLKIESDQFNDPRSIVKDNEVVLVDDGIDEIPMWRVEDDGENKTMLINFTPSWVNLDD